MLLFPFFALLCSRPLLLLLVLALHVVLPFVVGYYLVRVVIELLR